MKLISKYINEALQEEFIGQLISLFSMMGYVAESSKDAIEERIAELIYVLSENEILFTICDDNIYGKLIFVDNKVSLSFLSLNKEFRELTHDKFSFDDMYLILSGGTLRDLINAANKPSFIRSISHYRPEEVLTDY